MAKSSSAEQVGPSLSYSFPPFPMQPSFFAAGSGSFCPPRHISEIPQDRWGLRTDPFLLCHRPVSIDWSMSFFSVLGRIDIFYVLTGPPPLPFTTLLIRVTFLALLIPGLPYSLFVIATSWALVTPPFPSLPRRNRSECSYPIFFLLVFDVV